MRHILKNLPYQIILLFLALLFAGQGCASKRLAKQAQKLENAGMYELAAESYFRSFNANKKNIEAASGLRRNAQRTLDIKANSVNQAYLSGNDRETVYNYLDALAYRNRIRTTGIEISIPAQSGSYYEEAKPRYLDRSFEEARLLLDEENFSRAESIFAEIKNIDPSYQDLDQFMRISRSEPQYRQGVDQLNNGFYRRAYTTFTNLLNSQGSYKDARELREDALGKGMLTIAINDFSNTTGYRNEHIALKNRIVADISSMGNPFIQIIDGRNIDAFLREQELASQLGNEMKIGGLMSARAILTGNLQKFEIQEGRIQRSERKAYLKEVVTIEDPVTKEKSSKTNYHKVTFFEYRRENRASGSFQYQLSSTETGMVLLSGVIELSPADQINYAVFDGKPENLVPGHWEYRNTSSEKDNIRDEPAQVRNLQALFNARQIIKSPEVLRAELTNGISLAVSKAVDEYNPEQ